MVRGGGAPRQLPSVLENSASPKPTVASVQKMLLGSLKKELFAVKADDGDGWVTGEAGGVGEGCCSKPERS